MQEAQAILFPLSSLSDSPHLDSRYVGDIMLRYTDGNFEIYSRVAFLANRNNKIINSIHLNAEAHKILESGYEDIFDSKFFGNQISTYNIAHVLSEQGIPASVMIATSGGPLTRGGTGGFDVLLLYPDQGILINYTTQMYIIDTRVRGCLSNAHVEMELYPPGSGTSFFDLLKQTYWPQKMDYYKPIEESTSMSVETFYATFSKATEQCIETPAKLWPTPEP